MRIRIDGFPQGAPDRAEEYLRDKLAGSIVDALERHRVPLRPSSVLVSFTDTRVQAEPKLTRDKAKEETADFSSLVCAPKPNAALLRLPSATEESIQNAIRRFGVSAQVYKAWGLSQIDPTPRLSLNFFGPPGTGKTLAAHYIAHALGKKILEVSYADIVSKYFGEAAKNLAELYRFSAESNSVLFIDEAETLLSKRGSGQSDGADHAINSMRSQLLILIEKTPILSIFSSNLVSSYDEAFLSRLISVPFDLPDESMRAEIWKAHLPSTLPIAPGVSVAQLASNHPGLNGRQISRVVVEAAHRAAIAGKSAVSLDDFEWAIYSVKRINSAS